MAFLELLFSKREMQRVRVKGHGSAMYQREVLHVEPLLKDFPSSVNNVDVSPKLIRRHLFSISKNIRVERSRIVFAKENREMANHRLCFRYFRYHFAMASAISALCVKRESSALERDRHKVRTRRFAPLLELFTLSVMYIASYFFELEYWRNVNEIFPDLPVLGRYDFKIYEMGSYLTRNTCYSYASFLPEEKFIYPSKREKKKARIAMKNIFLQMQIKLERVRVAFLHLSLT